VELGKLLYVEPSAIECQFQLTTTSLQCYRLWHLILQQQLVEAHVDPLPNYSSHYPACLPLG
jgi:hypothetical protein